MPAPARLPASERAMMDAFTRALGDRVRTLREVQGIPQAVLARQVHLSREMVRQVELGEQSLSVDRLPRLAACLGVTVVELLAPVEPATLPPLEPLPIRPRSPRSESPSGDA